MYDCNLSVCKVQTVLLCKTQSSDRTRLLLQRHACQRNIGAHPLFSEIQRKHLDTHSYPSHSNELCNPEPQSLDLYDVPNYVIKSCHTNVL